ncbi:MAG: CBS domain-containing protein [Myxococcota bacterium]
MKCRDVMLTLVYRCLEDTSVAECARIMRDEHLGFLPVVDVEGSVLGVVTDRDLAVRVLAERLPPTTRVSEVMSTGPFLTCAPDDDLRELEKRMSDEKKGRVMVQDDNGTLLGVISLSDIAQHESSAVRMARLFQAVTRRESVSLARS